jgi:CRISPR/Cas system-associated exonuclease Cas4 (RecB family)
MSQYYNSQRIDKIYISDSKEPFKISRSKIDLFLECPKCFYLDSKLGVARPPGFPFTLNSAVDNLLKKEFNIYRINQTKHPLIEKYGVDAVPALHKDLNDWRDNFKGVQFLHKPTNLLIAGVIDDLWKNSNDEFIVVDYKSTAKNETIIELNKEWQKSYKRQMEIYQWLIRQNEYKVSNMGYFVYCNGQINKKRFDNKLEFEITLISYVGSDLWVEKVINDIYKCLNSNKIPNSASNCDYCSYIESVKNKNNL